MSHPMVRATASTSARAMRGVCTQVSRGAVRHLGRRVAIDSGSALCSMSRRAYHPALILRRPASAAAQAQPASDPSTSAVQEHAPPDLPNVQHNEQRISIGWTDGVWSRFHNDYLFDHCRCEKCFYAATKQRTKVIGDVGKEVHARRVHPEARGLRVEWSTPDGHASFFPWGFLRQASYDPPLQPVAPAEDKILWNANIAKSPPTVEYASLVASEGVSEEAAERGVLRWLTKIHEFGFCFVSGVPVDPVATEALIRRIGIIRETHYGGFYDFTADLNKGDMAYTNEALPAHTDNTYFTDPSGLQCFHLLSHPPPGTGGQTLLVDAFYAASILESLHPTAYALLSRLRVPCHASGTPGTLLRPQPQPVLKIDASSGQLVQVRWNNEDRGVLGRGWTPEEVAGWYDAARRWDEAVRSADAEYWVQLAPGTLVVIDNWRVMHGRSAFTGARRMCGAYVGRDDWASRLETLKRRFEDKPKDEEGRKEYEVWSTGW